MRSFIINSLLLLMLSTASAQGPQTIPQTLPPKYGKNLNIIITLPEGGNTPQLAEAAEKLRDMLLDWNEAPEGQALFQERLIDINIIPIYATGGNLRFMMQAANTTSKWKPEFRDSEPYKETTFVIQTGKGTQGAVSLVQLRLVDFLAKPPRQAPKAAPRPKQQPGKAPPRASSSKEPLFAALPSLTRDGKAAFNFIPLALTWFCRSANLFFIGSFRSHIPKNVHGRAK